MVVVEYGSCFHLHRTCPPVADLRSLHFPRPPPSPLNFDRTFKPDYSIGLGMNVESLLALPSSLAVFLKQRSVKVETQTLPPPAWKSGSEEFTLSQICTRHSSISGSQTYLCALRGPTR